MARKVCVCSECGEKFDYSDIRRVNESRGEFWGAPCYETMYYSPCCMDGFDEVWEYDDDEEEDEE